MMPLLRLGPFLLQLPGLALLASLWLGLSLSEHQADRLRLNRQDVYNLIFYGLIGGLVGARLGYALQHADAYRSNPLALLALTPATLLAPAGLLSGLLIAGLFGRRRRLPLRPTLDALAPAVAMLGVGVAAAHLLSGNAFGAPARLPWSIYLWGAYRHPTQVYELIAALGVAWIAWRQPLGAAGHGLNFVLVIALVAGAHVFIAGFRGDSLLMAGGFRVSQVVGLLVLGGALMLLRAWARQPPPAPVA